MICGPGCTTFPGNISRKQESIQNNLKALKDAKYKYEDLQRSIAIEKVENEIIRGKIITLNTQINAYENTKSKCL